MIESFMNADWWGWASLRLMLGSIVFFGIIQLLLVVRRLRFVRKAEPEFEVEHVNVERTLEGLRWKADMLVTNDFGERVWLKPLFVDEHYRTVDENTPGARRIGITDCCFENAPCYRHKKMMQG